MDKLSCAIALVTLLFVSSQASVAQTRYQIIPGESSIGFDGKSTLHDFTGKTTQITGTIESDFARYKDLTKTGVSIPVKSISTDNGMRDKEMYRRFRTESFPDIRYELATIEPVESSDTEGTKQFSTTGVLTISGVTREIRMTIQARARPDGKLAIRGEKPLLMSDFKIEPPKVMGIIRVQDEVRVFFDLICIPLDTPSDTNGGMNKP